MSKPEAVPLKDYPKGSGDYGKGNKWYNNGRFLLSLIIVILSAFSLPLYRNLNIFFTNWHPAFHALIGGIIGAMLTYLPMLVLDRKYALSNAILIGLLIAEFNVYGAPLDLPAPVVISFFVFMYTIGRDEAVHLWPKTYTGSL